MIGKVISLPGFTDGDRATYMNVESEIVETGFLWIREKLLLSLSKEINKMGYEIVLITENKLT